MKGLSTSKASTEDYLRELKLLAHHLEEKHQTLLKGINNTLLLIVELPQGRAHFLIGPEGIRHVEVSPPVEDKIVIAYRDLIRLVEKPSKMVRYILEGRVRVHGNQKKLLSILQELL
ncbi:MAG: hypothetical protein ACK4OF_07500 [Aquificaceae bacterium]